MTCKFQLSLSSFTLPSPVLHNSRWAFRTRSAPGSSLSLNFSGRISRNAYKWWSVHAIILVSRTSSTTSNLTSTVYRRPTQSALILVPFVMSKSPLEVGSLGQVHHLYEYIPEMTPMDNLYLLVCVRGAPAMGSWAVVSRLLAAGVRSVVLVHFECPSSCPVLVLVCSSLLYNKVLLLDFEWYCELKKKNMRRTWGYLQLNTLYRAR